jgi:hypothetical protein
MVIGGALILGGAASIVGASVEAGAIDARARPVSCSASGSTEGHGSTLVGSSTRNMLPPC